MLGMSDCDNMSIKGRSGTWDFCARVRQLQAMLLMGLSFGCLCCLVSFLLNS